MCILKTIHLRVLLAGLIVLALTFCSKKNAEDTEPVATCKITSTKSELFEKDDKGNITGRYVSEDTNTLNERLEVIAYETKFEWMMNQIFIQKVNSKSSLIYDSEGFLIKVTRETNGTGLENNQQVAFSRKEVGTYQYANERLIYADSKTITGNDAVTTEIFRYEYAGDGKLTKYVVESPINTTTQTYTNGILNGITESNSNIIRQAEYNAQGYQTSTKWNSNGKSYEYRTTYDSDGNPTKSENFIDGNVDNYTTNTYGQADLQFQARPVHKGHPVIKAPLGSNANLITSSISYARQNGQNLVKTSETTYTYEFNAKGYITTNRSISKRYNPLGTFSGSSEGKVTYTYTGCD